MAARNCIHQNGQPGSVETIEKPQGTNRRKFIAFWHHYIRQQLQDGMIKLYHVPAAKQKVDMLTNPLIRLEFIRQCTIFRIDPLSTQAAAK